MRRSGFWAGMILGGIVGAASLAVASMNVPELQSEATRRLKRRGRRMMRQYGIRL